MFFKKKVIPEGTFIPTKTRVVAIIQLCFAFTFMMWSVMQPFMADYLTYYSRLSLYKTVMGHRDLLVKMDPNALQLLQAKLERNAARFSSLPLYKQQAIEDAYRGLSKSEGTIWEKTKRAVHALWYDISPFAQAWMMLSIILCLMLLMRIEGAAQAAWLLPIIVLCCGVSSYRQQVNPTITAEAALFPTEEELVQDYLKEPLHGPIDQQREQLTRGWQLYLVTKWTKEAPSENTAVFSQQVESGEFLFNLARIQAQKEEGPEMTPPPEAVPLLLLVVYFIWNTFFAWFVNRKGALA